MPDHLGLQREKQSRVRGVNTDIFDMQIKQTKTKLRKTHTHTNVPTTTFVKKDPKDIPLHMSPVNQTGLVYSVYEITPHHSFLL